MKLKKNKKGSHVGLVLSFTLFITFMIFIYQVIAPTIRGFNEQSETIFEIESNLLKEISENVYAVRTYDNTSGCIQFDTPDSLTGQVIGVDLAGNEIPSNNTGGKTLVEGSHKLVTLYYGNNFSKTETLPSGSCVDIVPSNVLVEKRILEKRLIDFLNLVNEDYQETKNLLGILSNQEYEVIFKYSNGTEIGSNTFRDVKANIYSNQFVVNYLSLEGKEKTGRLIVKTW